MPNLRFKPVKNGKNQNVSIMGLYKGFLFTAATVYYLKHAKVPRIISNKKAASVQKTYR